MDHEDSSFPATISQDEAKAMLRAAFNLFVCWGLTDREGRILLGQPPQRTYTRWKTNQASKLSYDTTRRLSYLMGIHKALRHLFSNPEQGYAWIRKPNGAFNGRSALQRMLGGDIVDLATVRNYLDAEREGW